LAAPSGSALDAGFSPFNTIIREQFEDVFLADGTHIPCHVIWRKEKRIGVAFD
jgi:hypothetical protein